MEFLRQLTVFVQITIANVGVLATMEILAPAEALLLITKIIVPPLILIVLTAIVIPTPNGLTQVQCQPLIPQYCHWDNNTCWEN
jgi:cytochrome c oxidase subunit IV